MDGNKEKEKDPLDKAKAAMAKSNYITALRWLLQSKVKKELIQVVSEEIRREVSWAFTHLVLSGPITL